MNVSRQVVEKSQRAAPTHKGSLLVGSICDRTLFSKLQKSVSLKR